MLNRLFAKKPSRKTAKTLYAPIVEAARAPALYEQDGIPDTIEGRLESVMLHTALVIIVLRDGEPDELQLAVSQDLFDTMFDDFDAAMRELGVGDSGIGKKIRFMAEGFYGRAQAYSDALSDEDPQALVAVLARNLFADETAADRSGRFADYVRRSHESLCTQGAAALANGERPAFADA